MTARLLIGDVFDRLAEIPDGSVDCVITSPPYHLQRSYLPTGSPLKGAELGQEETPAEFLDSLLDVMDALWPVLSDHATFWINLGDKHAGSGGAGGDYNDGGLRDGQNRFGRTTRINNEWPLEQSVAWEPQLFGASLAYGRNILTGREHRQWITRPPVTWCKPSVTPGELTRRFRTATELIIYGGKHAGHFFDLDAVRTEPIPTNERDTTSGYAAPGQPTRNTIRATNPAGAPPFNWWIVGHGGGYDGAHFATFPPELLIRPIKAGCPEKVCLACGTPVERIVERTNAVGRGTRISRQPGHERQHLSTTVPDASERRTIGWTCACGDDTAPRRPGVILDPFAGSGTTLAVALGHGRDAIGIDLDPRNADLCEQRVGMFLEVEHAGPPLCHECGADLDNEDHDPDCPDQYLEPATIDVPTGTYL